MGPTSIFLGDTKTIQELSMNIYRLQPGAFTPLTTAIIGAHVTLLSLDPPPSLLYQDMLYKL